LSGKSIFRHCAIEAVLLIHDGLRDASNSIPLNELRELARLDCIGCHQITGKRKPLCRNYGSRAMGSGRCCENLNVNGVL